MRVRYVGVEVVKHNGGLSLQCGKQRLWHSETGPGSVSHKIGEEWHVKFWLGDQEVYGYTNDSRVTTNR